MPAIHTESPHISQTRTKCPRTYGVRVCPCAAFATEPCRPTACIPLAHPPAVPCPLPPVRWTFTFSAKEKDSETGLSYFGSRYYSSDLSIWLSVDPMSDKYPSLSPYVYCADNPVRLVDPEGEDIWEIDENGKLTWKEHNTEIDVLYATKTKQSKDFPVGTIREMIEDKGFVKYDGKDIQVNYQYLDINDDDLASCFFEFVSENTEIEWSLTQTGKNDNRIAHDIQYTDVNGNKLDLELSNGCGSVLLQMYIKNKVPVRSSKHSHPYIEGRNIVADPSGYDKGLKQWFINEYKERANIKYEVYGKKEDTWKYMPY